MQPEQSIEIDGRTRTALRQGERTAQACVIRIAVRRHRGKPIERATEDHDNESPIVWQRRKGEAGMRSRQGKGAASDAGIEQGSAGQHGRYLRWNSGLAKSRARP